METKELNKQEYLLRINKVTDYIHNNIDQPLPLQKMAGIACFSPFHFHRVFTILTGETPTDYIKRTRIEKAAQLLKRNKELSATEIARLCGFSSHGVFPPAKITALYIPLNLFRFYSLFFFSL